MTFVDEAEVQRVMSALAHPIRRRILRELDTQLGYDIKFLTQRVERTEHLVISRQGLHKHLMVLRKANLLFGGGLGQGAVYFMNPRPIRKTFCDLGRLFKRKPFPKPIELELDEYLDGDGPLDD